jgi:hypothetical protein
MKRRDSFFRESCGSASVMFGILMFVFIGLLAFVIDLAHVQNVKNELQNAADAAALAGARALMPYTGVGKPPWDISDPPPCEVARDAAMGTMDPSFVNYVDMGPKQRKITIDPNEVITGYWDYKPMEASSGKFSGPSCNSSTNAVKVTARMRGDLSQGSVTMTLAQIFGVSTVNPSATAIAAVGYLTTLPKNSAGGFLALDHDYLSKAYEFWKQNPNQPFYFILGPSGGQQSYQYADNGSWALPEGYNGANDINTFITDGTQTAVETNDSVNLNNGMTSAPKTLQDAIAAAKKVDVEPPIGLDMSVYGVYANASSASPFADSWVQDTPVNAFWDITMTNFWTNDDIMKAFNNNPSADPNLKNVINNFITGLNDQMRPQDINGIGEFYMRGPGALAGPGGNALPSNAYGFLVKLVQ